MIKSIRNLGDELTKLISNDNSEKIDLKRYKYILEKYNGLDWKEFIQINPLNYNKCRVYCNNLFDIYIITWNNLQSSKIHNHPEYGCLNKVLSGSFTEILYNKNDLNNPQRFTNIKTNHISYIDDTIGYHKIKNNDNLTVSIHIYSPPKFKTTYFK